MQAAEKELTPFENLLTDLLLLILIQTQDPIHLGRLMQVSTAFKGKLLGDKSNALWQLFLQSEFPKFQIPQNSSNYRRLFMTQAEGKTKTSKLTKEHRRLHNLIKIGDLTSIRSGKNLPDMSNEKFLAIKDNGHVTAIWLAIHFNRQEILHFFYDLLCRNVFSKKIQDQSGRTQLHWASTLNILPEVERLIKLANDINATDRWKFTPLALAAYCGNNEVLKVLLAAGADKRPNHVGGTPLHMAAEGGQASIARQLLAAKYDVHHTTEAGASPLLIAAQYGKLKTVNVLLTAGANPNVVTLKGDSALFIAAAAGHLEIVGVLITAQSNLDQVNNDGWSALHIAVLNGHLAVVEVLVEAKCNLNLITNGGVSALHLAAHHKHLDITIVLLRAGAELNRAIGENRTPLYLAASAGQADIVKVLLKAGAEVNRASIRLTPLRAAEMGRHQSAYSILKLWQVYEQQKNQSLYQQVTAIINTPTSLSWSSSVTSYFFTSQEDRQCQEIIKDLTKLAKDIKEGGGEAAIRELLELKKSAIPAEKHQFIMDFVLAPKLTVQDQPTKSFELK